MATFTEATFTGSNGAEISTVDSNVVKHGSSAGDCLIQDNRGRSSSCLYYLATDPTSADYTATGTWLYKAWNSSRASAVYARLQTGSHTGYRIYFDGALDVWRLQKVINGSVSNLGSAASENFGTVGSNTPMKIEVTAGSSATVKAYKKGSTTPFTSVSGETSIPAAGKVGFFIASAGTTDGHHLDTLTGDQEAGGGTSVIVTHDLRAAISTSVSTAHDTNLAVSTALGSVADAVARVSTAIAAAHDTRTAASTARSTGHDARAVVASSLAFAHDTRVAVATAIESLVDTLANVSTLTGSITATHDTRVTVATARATLHDAMAAVATGRATTHDLRATVAATVAAVHDTMVSVATGLARSHDTRAEVVTQLLRATDTLAAISSRIQRTHDTRTVVQLLSEAALVIRLTAAITHPSIGIELAHPRIDITLN